MSNNIISAAFDTIDHGILLERLDDWSRVTGKALNWFKSYLTVRCQMIKLADCLSSKADLRFGVPRGSVLGPLLFTVHTTPLSSMISGNAISHHLHADDSQLHVSFASEGSTAALNGLQSCLASVQSWMLTNKLKLNSDKTEFLLIGNERQWSKHLSFLLIGNERQWSKHLLFLLIGNERQWSKHLSMFPIELLGVETNAAKYARSLGVIFDKTFTLHSLTSAVRSSFFYHMRDLRRIRSHLDLNSAKLLASCSCVQSSQLLQFTFTASFPSLVANTLEYCPRSVCWLENPVCRTACLSSLHAFRNTPIPFTEIKQRN